MEKKERAKAIVAFLGVLALGVKLIFGIQVPQEMIDYAVDIVLGLWSIYAWWRNNYVSKKGLAQKDVLKKNNLL